MRHVILDDTGIPTGAAAERLATAEPLGDTVFDEAAPTDALRRGGYRSARPGEQDTTVFSINVS